MKQGLKGKTVLITGASGGLGEQIAYQCAANGAGVILAARNLERLKEVQKNIRETYHAEAVVYQLDVGQHGEVRDVVREIFSRHKKVDCLVNNAGFGLFKTITDSTVEEAEQMFKVNVIGLIAMTKMVLPEMMKAGSGHIINIASQAGKIATPKSSIYAATKKAVLGFTDSLRMEVKDRGIYVTAVNPGPMATNFFEIADESGNYIKNVGRWVLRPERVAEKVVNKMFTPVREINLPRLMNAAALLYTLFPGFVEKVGKRAFYKK